MNLLPGLDSEELRTADTDAAITLLVSSLKKIPNPRRTEFIGTKEIHTVADLIDHLERKTPEGLHILDLITRIPPPKDPVTEQTQSINAAVVALNIRVILEALHSLYQKTH